MTHITPDKGALAMSVCCLCFLVCAELTSFCLFLFVRVFMYSCSLFKGTDFVSWHTSFLFFSFLFFFLSSKGINFVFNFHSALNIISNMLIFYFPLLFHLNVY